MVGNSGFGEKLLCYAAFSVSNISGCCWTYWKSFRIMNIIFDKERKVKIFSSFLLNFELDCQGVLLKGLLYSCSFTILIDRFLMKSCFLCCLCLFFSQSVSLSQYVVLSVRLTDSLFQLASESLRDIIARRRSDYRPRGAIFAKLNSIFNFNFNLS